MDFEIESSQFIQIIYDDNRNHWITIANIESDEPEEICACVFDQTSRISEVYYFPC